MRLLVVLSAITGSAATLLSTRQARYDALPEDKPDPSLELIFATALWRHGDRAADNAVPRCDPFTESDWKFGGGGYGQLSPEGMKMHFQLGRKLRKRYEDDFKILSPVYNAREIYVRSTNVNRTLTSAYANMAGMYSGFGVEGQNFPSKKDLPGWPTGYVPIPVHAVDYWTDHLLHPDANCDRLQQLYDMVHNSPGYQNFLNEPQVAQVLKYLSDQTGIVVTPSNLYQITDPIHCEDNHIEELNQTGATIESFYPWFYTGELSSITDSIQDRDDDFTQGEGNPNGINGIDVSVEIPKIHGGDLIKLIVNNIHGVLKCRDNENSTDCRHFYKKLRYYAMSAHDSTVMALLTTLGARKYVISTTPQYSATVLLEVYEDRTSKERAFKVLYHADENSGFKTITGFVRGCNVSKDICPIAVLDDIVVKYAPETDVETLCNTPVNISPVIAASLKSDQTILTDKTSGRTTITKDSTTTSTVSSLSLLTALFAIILFFFIRL